MQEKLPVIRGFLCVFGTPLLISPPRSLSGVDYSLEIHSFLAHGCANMFPVKASYFIYK